MKFIQIYTNRMLNILNVCNLDVFLKEMIFVYGE